MKNIFKNKINYIKKNDNLLRNALVNVKEKRLFEKALKKIAKMQNLSQNEFNQIERIRNLLRDELEQIDDINKNEISDIRRILNRLRNILPKKDRKEIKDKLYKIEHQINI